MDDGGVRRAIELDYDTSVSLLSGENIGRVALCTPAGPRILPVSYSLVDDSVIFRTAPYSVLGTYAWNSQLAFEVDVLESETGTGWSVVAIGHGVMLEDLKELATIRTFWDTHPGSEGQRYLYVRLRWTELTGRRFGQR